MDPPENIGPSESQNEEEKEEMEDEGEGEGEVEEEEETIEERRKRLQEERKRFRLADEHLSSREMARRHNYSADKFHRYRFKDFGRFERATIIKNVVKKYEENTYIPKKDLDNLDEWKRNVMDSIVQLAGKCALKEKLRSEGKDPGDYNFSEENRKWKSFHDLRSEIDNLCKRHERTVVNVPRRLDSQGDEEETELSARRKDEIGKQIKIASQRLKMLKDRRKRRKEDERIRDEGNKKILQNLKYQDDVTQLKYFIRIHGPENGIKEYDQWKDAHKFSSVTTTFKEKIENPDLKKDLIDDEDDDLFDDL